MNRTPDLARRAFARTNTETVAQRVALLRELVPGVASVGELCSGDCSRQHAAYRDQLGVARYRALDLQPDIVRMNRAQGIDCVQGDVRDHAVLRGFLDLDVLFFGPPLSEDCDGHNLLSFSQVVPAYGPFVRLLYGDLRYQGVLVAICPKATTMGDIRRLHAETLAARPEVGLGLLHYTHAAMTDSGKPMEARLKYIELWLGPSFADRWEVRRTGPLPETPDADEGGSP
jgi:hypothetical protein